jgi:hypothetical protein
MRMTSLALVTCLSVGLVACGTSKPQQPVAAGSPRHPAGGASNAKGDCPRGRLLPPGEGEAIDYVDFLQSNGRSYNQAHVPVTASQLGPVVTHVRCSLIAEEDQQHGPSPNYQPHGIGPPRRDAGVSSPRILAGLPPGRLPARQPARVPCPSQHDWANLCRTPTVRPAPGIRAPDQQGADGRYRGPDAFALLRSRC